MATLPYDTNEGEFVDFDTLNDWSNRDKAQAAEIARLRAANEEMNRLAGYAADEINSLRESVSFWESYAALNEKNLKAAKAERDALLVRVKRWEPLADAEQFGSGRISGMKGGKT